jgi:hypothetical protein
MIGLNFRHDRPSCSTLNIFLIEMMFIEKQGFLLDRIKKKACFSINRYLPCLPVRLVLCQFLSRKTLHFPKPAPSTWIAYLPNRRHAVAAGAGADQAIRCDGVGDLKAMCDGVFMLIGSQHQDPSVEHPSSYTATAASPLLERHLKRHLRVRPELSVLCYFAKRLLFLTHLR